ncbi:alpha/beta hydrolase [Paenibacillus hunanensis]|uniref:alpha/beta hydrolase family protein n=1 Tax=Paenibacillus hunanensis TaxID=539262 RepID=UPI0020275DEA|nr:alpha/beta hydrolase [Paenibacillus hunanensis]MCL9660676.1 alpha/beta hydrolase [Paenibacillus hunanensis]
MMQPITTTINGKTLRGTAHIPDGQGQRFPTVLMFHGFGSMRNEYFYAFVHMARQLEEAGIASLRFDFSGHGESDGEFFDFTFSNEVQEGIELVQYTRTLDFVDEQRISLLGMSLGSVAASMVAGAIPDQIDSLCLWSPAAVFTDEILVRGTLQGRTIDIVQEQGYFDFNSLKLGPAFFEDVKHIQVYEAVRPYKGKVKILHGIDDWIAPVEYARRYVDTYEQPVELVEVEGVDHSWGDVPSRALLYKQTLDFFTSKP